MCQGHIGFLSEFKIVARNLLSASQVLLNLRSKFFFVNIVFYFTESRKFWYKLRITVICLIMHCLQTFANPKASCAEFCVKPVFTRLFVWTIEVKLNKICYKSLGIWENNKFKMKKFFWLTKIPALILHSSSAEKIHFNPQTHQDIRRER